MADNKTANDVQQALEQQVADLRGELKRLSKSLASRSNDLRDSAEDAFDDASGRLRHAAQVVRERGQAGLIGIAIGVAIGCVLSDRR